MKRAKKVEAWANDYDDGTPDLFETKADAEGFAKEFPGYVRKAIHLTEPSPLTAKERDELRKLRRVAKWAAEVTRFGWMGPPKAMHGIRTLRAAVAALEKEKGR